MINTQNHGHSHCKDSNTTCTMECNIVAPEEEHEDAAEAKKEEDVVGKAGEVGNIQGRQVHAPLHLQTVIFILT